MDKPTPSESPDFSEVIRLVKDHFEYRHAQDYHEDNDDRTYIFEASLRAVYGSNVFKYLNGLS